MEKPRSEVRYVPYESLIPGRIVWGVLDRHTNKLVETAGGTEKYPYQWAKNRADKLNKD